MMISAVSSSRRSRAAHDAPPAEPPTMMTFMIFPSLDNVLEQSGIPKPAAFRYCMNQP
jgi:hypothetical protein